MTGGALFLGGLLGIIGGGLGLAQDSGSVFGIDGWILLIVGIVCLVLLAALLAFVFRDQLFKRAQTGSSGAQGLALKASAPGTLPLLVVVPPRGCV